MTSLSIRLGSGMKNFGRYVWIMKRKQLRTQQLLRGDKEVLQSTRGNEKGKPARKETQKR